MSALELFEEHRPVLFGLAYRMLSSAADAEDIVQDACLRWSTVDTASVAHPRAYLCRIVTHLAINRAQSAAVRRESYVGPWLPEPLVTAPDSSAEVERAEAVSLAMLVVLETLSPLERAVFILKEVFGFGHPEIAGMLDRSEASVRQVASRARRHVRARRPRYDAPAAVRRRATDEFLAACVGGDLNRVLAMLAPEVTAWTDGGGKIRAALRPISGADKVARWLLGILATPIPDARVHDVLINGEPGTLLTSGARPDSVACCDFHEDGTVSAIRLIRNPDKLTRVRYAG